MCGNNNNNNNKVNKLRNGGLFSFLLAKIREVPLRNPCSFFQEDKKSQYSSQRNKLFYSIAPSEYDTSTSKQYFGEIKNKVFF